MKRKELILHIGANKTGSSAIQGFLSLNCKHLLQEGIFVPPADLNAGNKITGFHVWRLNELIQNSEANQEVLLNLLDKLFDEHGTNTVLLSAENLAANPNAPNLFAKAALRYEIKVLIYIRRQDDYLLSSWQQWHAKAQSDIWAWLLRNVGHNGNWKTYLTQWLTVIPQSNIHVRLMQRDKLFGGDVVQDFHEFLALKRPYSEFEYPKNRENRSLSDAIVQLVQGNQDIFNDPHDTDFYRFVLKMTNDKYLKTKGESALTHGQRMAILNRYENSNNWVKDTFFPSHTGPLFKRPTPEESVTQSPQQRLDKQLQFLTTALYNVYRNNQKPS